MIDVVAEMANKFEQLNNTISKFYRVLYVYQIHNYNFYIFLVIENNFDEVTQKESTHKFEFDGILSRMDSNIIELDSSIKDCRLISEIL